MLVYFMLVKDIQDTKSGEVWSVRQIYISFMQLCCDMQILIIMGHVISGVFKHNIN